MSTSTSLKPKGGYAGFEFFIRSALAGGFAGGVVSNIHELFHLLYRSLNVLITRQRPQLLPWIELKSCFKRTMQNFNDSRVLLNSVAVDASVEG